MENNTKNKIALVLGSGASVGGNFRVNYGGEDFEPPMDHNFFETLLLKIILKPEEYPALCYYQKRFKEKSFEATFSKIDLISKLCLGGIISEEPAYIGELKVKAEAKANTDISYRNKLERELRKKENVVPSMAAWEFISLFIKIYENLEAPISSDPSPLKSLIDKLRDRGLLYGIVSYNYDLSVEKIFDRFYYPIIDGNENTDGKIHLFKLHGSLNWKEEANNTGFTIKIVDESVPLKHYGDKGYSQPSIIPPTLFKQEINIDYQRDIRANFYKNLWHWCWKYIHEADTIIIVGFSFPATDWHAQILFESAGSKRGGFKKIVYCHKDDKPEKINEIRSIFGGADFIEESKGLESLADNIGKFLKFIES